jgi:ribosomal protein S21
MIKRFMRKIREDGILHEVFLRRFYEKPSVRQRSKAARALARRKKALNLGRKNRGHSS